MTPKELRAKKVELAGKIKELAERSAACAADGSTEEWSAEDEGNWTQLNADYNDNEAALGIAERAERAAAVEASLLTAANDAGAPGRGDVNSGPPEGRTGDPRTEPITEDERALGLQAWCLRQAGRELQERHTAAVARTGIDIDARQLDIPLRIETYSRFRESVLHPERRAQPYMSTVATEGGETIPEGFVNNFEMALLQFGGVRQVATIMRTATGNALPWPTADDTGNTGELLAEETEAAELAVTTALITLNAYKFSSKIVRVSAELLQDSAFNLATWLGGVLGERIGRVETTYFTTGTGSSQPNGIVTAATLGVTAAGTTSILDTELMDLVHSVDPAYRTQGGWMMHDSIVLAVRKLKDSDGAFVWQPGLTMGQPDRLLAYPLQVNQGMASTIEASAKVALFGQLSKYIIRDAGSLRMYRLVERYREFDQDGFVAFMRSDGELLDAGTNPVKYMQMAAS